MKRLFASVVLFSLFALIAAPGGEKKATPPIEGSWTLTASIAHGNKIADSEITEAKVVVTFTKGKYAFTYNGRKGDTGTYKLDAKAKPANIDLTLAEGTNEGKTQLGIYKLETDQILFAFGKLGSRERPTNFDATKDVEVHTFKRNK